ncbi:MAG: 5'-nucleotidase C-terminal domain-containing protein [Lachnospiraceae bacterium]|nr:5'-nucleotidase C-terminal domain-containing protein [Lachnospiraceae bacterium]
MRQVGKKRLLALLMSVVMAMTLFAGMTVSVAAADQDIIVLFTNDVHCGVDDNIGYAGLALYKQQMLAKTPYVTLVDAGDFVQGAPIGTLSKGAFIVDIMNLVGYDVVVPGNHEFDYAMDQFFTLSKRTAVGFTTCNFIDLKTGNAAFAPYKMITYGDTKIAYVGITTPESFTKSTPAYFQDKAGNYIYSLCEDETGERLYAAVQLAVDTARAEGADIVVAIGHLGQDGTTDRWRSDTVIKNTNGIDVMLDGHSHEEYVQTVKNKDGKNVTLAQTGTKLNAIGKMTIATNGRIKVEMVKEVKGGPVVVTTTEGEAKTYTVQPGDTLNKIAATQLGDASQVSTILAMNEGTIKNANLIYPGMVLNLSGSATTVVSAGNVDPMTDTFVKALQDSFEATLSRKIGRTNVDLTTKNPATGDRLVRSGETNLGDLAADAYKTILETDIGFANGGGVRADIKTGDITYKDALTVFPFNNMACVVEASGQVILDALEMSAKNYPGESGGFLQTAGLTYTINSAVESSVVVDEKGNFVSVAGARRVSDVMVNGQPIDPNKTYTIGSHNYMLQDAGDGYTMFQNCRVIRDNVMPDVDVLATYIEKNLNGVVGDTYKNPTGTSRIIIK